MPLPDYLPHFGPLIANSLGVHFIYDVTTARVQYVSEAYERVFESPAADVHDHLADLLARAHPNDVHYVRTRLAAAAEEEVVPDLEVRVDRPAGGRSGFACRSAACPSKAVSSISVGKSRTLSGPSRRCRMPRSST